MTLWHQNSHLQSKGYDCIWGDIAKNWRHEYLIRWNYSTRKKKNENAWVGKAFLTIAKHLKVIK